MKQNKCEICGLKLLTDIHHIQSRSLGGSNKPYNKCELCPNCHRLVHEGKIILEGRFLTSDCLIGQTELIWRQSNHESITNSNPDTYIFINGSKMINKNI